MTTVIEFGGDEGHWVVVEEDVETVHAALSGAGTQAAKLTHEGQDEPVYVNPAQVACWYPGTEAEPPQRTRTRRFTEAYRGHKEDPGQLRRRLQAALDLEAADVRHSLR